MEGQCYTIESRDDTIHLSGEHSTLPPKVLYRSKSCRSVCKSKLLAIHRNAYPVHCQETHHESFPLYRNLLIPESNLLPLESISFPLEQTSLPKGNQLPNNIPIASTLANNSAKFDPISATIITGNRVVAENFRTKRDRQPYRTTGSTRIVATPQRQNCPSPSRPVQPRTYRARIIHRQTEYRHILTSPPISPNDLPNVLARGTSSLPQFLAATKLPSFPASYLLLTLLVLFLSLSTDVTPSSVDVGDSTSGRGSQSNSSPSVAAEITIGNHSSSYQPQVSTEPTSGITYSIAVFVPLICGNSRYSFGESVRAAFADQAKEAMERRLVSSNYKVGMNRRRRRRRVLDEEIVRGGGGAGNERRGRAATSGGRNLSQGRVLGRNRGQKRGRRQPNNEQPDLKDSTPLSNHRAVKSSRHNSTANRLLTRRRSWPSKGRGRQRFKRSVSGSGGTEVNFEYRIYDSCDEDELFSTLFPAQQDFTAIVGPGNTDLCETASRLNNQRNKATFSWTCTDSTLSDRSIYRTFSRTTGSIKTSSSAILSLLTYFRLHYVAIIYDLVLPHRQTANQLHIALTDRRFDVTAYLQTQIDQISGENLAKRLLKIDPLTKAIVLCVSDGAVESSLKSLFSAGLTVGQHAIFLLKTDQPLMVDEKGEMPVRSVFPAEYGNNISATMSQALQSVLVVGGSASGHSKNENISDYTHSYQKRVYNAVRLSMVAIERAFRSVYESGEHGADIVGGGGAGGDDAHRQGGRGEDLARLEGDVIVNSARNVSFNCLHGQCKTDNNAEIILTYNVWDYQYTDSPNDKFVKVLELKPLASSNTDSTSSVKMTIRTLADISWPISHYGPPAPDSCFFGNKCVTEFGDAYIAVIVVGALTFVISTFIIVKFFRRYFALKDMQRGPHKILLQSGDLIYPDPTNSRVHASKSSKSVGLERPDLLRTSQKSISRRSSITKEVMHANTARYNGDLVFVKNLKMRDFEVKNTIRVFIRQLREVRHENITSFIGCLSEPSRPSLVFEYCSRRSLEDVIKNHDIKLDWDFKLSLLTDLVKGMKYIHTSLLRYHGNLKSGNCVIDSRWVLKVTDYGVNDMYQKCKSKRTLDESELLWTAPEHLRDERLVSGSSKGDVYSFAIILQEVILRSTPYSMLDIGHKEIIRKVRKPPPMCRPSVSQQAAAPYYIQIMKRCWSEQPDHRPDFEQLNVEFKEFNKGKKSNIVDAMFSMLEKYSNNLEEIVRERTVALEEEKKKTENLLTQMLPQSVAQNLLMGKPVEPESFDDVTIYFSDIVGFTTISACSTPIEVVNLLNDLYTMFDSTIDDYDVYKVETIGDAYMVVSGLPRRNGHRHAAEISTMALDLLSQCGQFRIRHMPDTQLRLRIGLHTGPCVTGVVGLRMPRYCLFGDTVNTASRMESTGAPFRVHISEDTKHKLDIITGYQIQFRGVVELKGKGDRRTYWLIGKDGFTKPLPDPPADGQNTHGISLQQNTQEKGITGVSEV